MEQQYTCPFCWKGYTRFTIHEHYGCGVEPLETTEEIEQELAEISEEMAEQESPSDSLQDAVENLGNEFLEVAEEIYEVEVLPAETIPPVEQPKPEPKKRGRKPKAKAD